MTFIEKNVEIPEDRHLSLDLTFPEGFTVPQVKLRIYITPGKDAENLVPLSELAGNLKDSPDFAGDPMEILPKLSDDD